MPISKGAIKNMDKTAILAVSNFESKCASLSTEPNKRSIKDLMKDLEEVVRIKKNLA